MPIKRAMRRTGLTLAAAASIAVLTASPGCNYASPNRPPLDAFFASLKSKNFEALADFIDPVTVSENDLDIVRTRAFISGMLEPLPADLLNLRYAVVEPPTSLGSPAWSSENQVVVDATSIGSGTAIARITFKRDVDVWRADLFEFCSLLSSKHGTVKERMVRLGSALDRAGLTVLKRPSSRMLINRSRIQEIADGKLSIEKAFEPY